jgi:hypothetical protein
VVEQNAHSWRATSAGSSSATPISAFIASTGPALIGVRVARGMKCRTSTPVSASSRRSACVKPRRPALLAQ